MENNNQPQHQQQPQSYQLYPPPYPSIPQMPPYNPYLNHINNPYENQMCIPNMAFGQYNNPYIVNATSQPPQMPLYNYIPINNMQQQQFNANQNNFNNLVYSQVNQTGVQSKSKLRPISSQNRTTEVSKIEEYSGSVNRNNLSNRITSAHNCSRYVKGDYKPYSLKEYKELEKVGIVLGGLGPNIGTKDWEEKKDKMKKMEKYSNHVNSLSKMKVKKKKESLEELIQKEKQKKIRLSCRRKCYEYGKLVRPKSRTGNTIDYYESPLFNDSDVINKTIKEKRVNKIKDKDKITLNCELKKENEVKENSHSDNVEKEEKSSHNLYLDNKEANISLNNHYNDNISTCLNIEMICRERENYKAKIEAIKETLLK